MTRIEEFKKAEQERIDECILRELFARAQAAAVLAEPFELDGVSFERGCGATGKVDVKGIKRLCDILGVIPVQQEKVYSDGARAVYSEIDYEGVTFSEMTEFVTGGKVETA